MTENTTVNETEIDVLDDSFWEEYTTAESGTKTLPTDGRYTVRMPDSIPDSAFVVRADRDGKKYLAITLDPVTIVSEDPAIDGHAVRFLRVSTKPETNFQKEGESWKAVGTLNASSAADVLQNFESTDRPKTVDEWKLAFRTLEGQQSHSPFYLTWGGYDKAATGKAKYLKSKDFPTLGDGTRPSFIERKDEVTGNTRRVFANLQLGRRGAAPRA